MPVDYSCLSRSLRSFQAGFSLIELVVFIIVLGLGLAGVTLVINRTLLAAPEALVQTRAMELAQLYLDEILTKRFDENTGQGGLPVCDSPDPATTTNPCSNVLGAEGAEAGKRGEFNDVDDYNGLNNAPPQGADGNILANYDDYAVAVSIAYAGDDFDNPAIPLDVHNRYAKRITIQITTPRNNSYSMTAYRLNF